MSAKKPSVAKDPAAKRLSRKQAKERAELSAREALKTNFVPLFPEVTPLELAHLVAAMGLGEQKDGPSKALSLLSRSAAYIEGMKAQFERLNSVIAPGKVDEIRIMAELGLSSLDSRRLLKSMIAEGHAKIATPGSGHRDALTTTNIYHHRDHLGKVVSAMHGKAAGKATVEAIKSAVTC